VGIETRDIASWFIGGALALAFLTAGAAPLVLTARVNRLGHAAVDTNERRRSCS